MPELPEVERARKLIQDSCAGYKIAKVLTVEDKIVYTAGTDHEQFAKEIQGRTIRSCERKGKTFWMVLDGEGRHPVMHFGMTGMIQLQGHEPTWYRRRPRERSSVWPPRFHKFVLELEPQPGSVGTEPVQLAFLDGRRLGRLRLVADPVEAHPPVSQLGFDPILSHPTLEEFQDLIKKKKGTTKGLIMDQAFSAGVGNWVADEVLYHARIHPACPVPLLTPTQVEALHHQIRAICEYAVNVNADHHRFPEDWLFRWRWDKGREAKAKGKAKAKAKRANGGESEEGEGEDLKPKSKPHLPLPDGSPATIEWIEVGGRTTAFVKELQKMPEGVEIKPKISKGGKGSRSKRNSSDSGESSALSEADEDLEEIKPRTKTLPSRGAKRKVKAEPISGSELSEEEVKPAKTTPRQKAMAAKAVSSDAKPVETPTRRPKKAESSLLITSRPYSSLACSIRSAAQSRTDLTRSMFGRPFSTLSATQVQSQGRIRPVRPVVMTSAIVGSAPSGSATMSGSPALGRIAGIAYAVLRRRMRV